LYIHIHIYYIIFIGQSKGACRRLLSSLPTSLAEDEALLESIDSGRVGAGSDRYSFYLLYYYKNTHIDAEGAA
jgi:hypothetical protein